MSKFKETPRMYVADEVDSEIAILTQSRDFWRKKAEELQIKIDNPSPSDNNDFKKVCPKCGRHTLSYICDGVWGCEYEECTYSGKPIPKS